MKTRRLGGLARRRAEAALAKRLIARIVEGLDFVEGTLTILGEEYTEPFVEDASHRDRIFRLKWKKVEPDCYSFNDARDHVARRLRDEADRVLGGKRGRR